MKQTPLEEKIAEWERKYNCSWDSMSEDIFAGMAREIALWAYEQVHIGKLTADAGSGMMSAAVQIGIDTEKGVCMKPFDAWIKKKNLIHSYSASEVEALMRESAAYAAKAVAPKKRWHRPGAEQDGWNSCCDDCVLNAETMGI